MFAVNYQNDTFQTRYEYLLKFILAFTDIILVNIAFLGAFFHINGTLAHLRGDRYWDYFIICNLIWLFCVTVVGSYRQKNLLNLEQIYRTTYKSVLIHAVFFILYLTLTKDVRFSREFMLVFYCTMVAGFIFSRFLGTVCEMILKKHFNIRRSVAVLGKNNTGNLLADYFERNETNFNFEGFLDEGVNKNLSPQELIMQAAEKGIKEIYVSLSPDKMTDACKLLKTAEKLCVRVKFIPDFGGNLDVPFTVSYMGDFPVITLRKEPLSDIKNRSRKRAFDLAFSTFVIVFIMSWLYPVIALLIKLQSPGPVLFKQLRSGKNNESFWCYKFRSMRVNKESDTRQASKDDDRITPIGKFLRKTSLDELPQFFNVFLGHMSVVGPRPHMLKHTEHYSGVINQFMVRHFLKPGISGWAQVNGFRGETRHPRMMEKRVEHDIWYMENWSNMLDVKIIFMTAINIFKGEENAG